MDPVITHLEYLSDRVRIHYQCGTPWGVPDHFAIVELLYESIRSLPSPPALNRGFQDLGVTWEESVYVPVVSATVSLRFAQWEETDDFRMQALIGGPYLLNAEPAHGAIPGTAAQQ